MPTATTAILGAADMAQAIRSGRPHRASGALAFHVLEVMEAFQTSSDSGRGGERLDPPGAAGADAGLRSRPANSTDATGEAPKTEEATMREALIVWGGWSGHEPEKGAQIVAGMLEAEASRSMSKTRPRPSPIRRSPT